MANKTATFFTRINYVDEDDEDQVMTSTVAVEYNAFLVGELDVPNATAGSTAYSIPFGSVTNATGVWIRNATGQDLTLKINGSAALHLIKTGSDVVLPADGVSGGPLTAVSLTTTATQSGEGQIEFFVAGDPI